MHSSAARAWNTHIHMKTITTGTDSCQLDGRHCFADRHLWCVYCTFLQLMSAGTNAQIEAYRNRRAARAASQTAGTSYCKLPGYHQAHNCTDSSGARRHAVTGVAQLMLYYSRWFTQIQILCLNLRERTFTHRLMEAEPLSRMWLTHVRVLEVKRLH